ncbi:MAG: SRPBCC domain-containing protein [Bacteroidetes bacterium]|nr:MAG: SRPBCC domain-containing protein [Bacteroidota bacterium]
MTTHTSTHAQSGKALTVKKTFSRETSVSIDIQADAAIVWTLLTQAADFPRWNSTVISIEGEIGLGNTIKLKSTLDPKRVFKLKVKEFTPEKRLAWGDGQGTRVYTLTPAGNGRLTFSMSEKIGSPMFPLFSKYIPPFDASFEQFAADLKKEAEAIQNTKN